MHVPSDTVLYKGQMHVENTGLHFHTDELMIRETLKFFFLFCFVFPFCFLSYQLIITKKCILPCATTLRLWGKQPMALKEKEISTALIRTWFHATLVSRRFLLSYITYQYQSSHFQKLI